LDIVDPKFILENFMDFQKDYELVDEIEKSQRKTVLTWPLIDIEYETFNPFLNMGGLLVAFSFYLAQIILYYIIVAILRVLGINKTLNQMN
jgi:hypothetical protein